MTTVSLVELAWELHKVGVSPDEIAQRVGKHRATIYRWMAGIRLYGIRRYLERCKNAKKGRRQKRKTNPILKDRIYRIREEFHRCCGEKIRYRTGTRGDMAGRVRGTDYRPQENSDFGKEVAV